MAIRKGRGRGARAAAARGPDWLRWAVWAGIGLAALAAAPVWAQTVPEVVKPRADTPTLPPGAGNDLRGAAPRSENSLPRADTSAPVPDKGVIAPPVSKLGATPVIRPPATDRDAVIPPPGSAGGNTKIVPK